MALAGRISCAPAVASPTGLANIMFGHDRGGLSRFAEAEEMLEDRCLRAL